MREAYNPKKKRSFLFFTNDDFIDEQYNEAIKSLCSTIADLNNEASGLAKNYPPEQRKALIEYASNAIQNADEINKEEPNKKPMLIHALQNANKAIRTPTLENQKQLVSSASLVSRAGRIYRDFGNALFGIGVALFVLGLAGGAVATILTAGTLTHAFLGVSLIGLLLTWIGASMLKNEGKTLQFRDDLADNLNKVGETVKQPSESESQAAIGLSK